MAGHSWAMTSALCACVAAVSLLYMGEVQADCWLIEGEKGFVWLAICSQNQPPYESIPQQINSTILDLRLNDNKIKSVQFSSLSRFSNLTYLNLTKNEISYIEDGAFSGQYNLQVLQLGYNRLRNLTEGILRGLGKLEYLYLQANLIETVTPNAFGECPNIVNIDLSMNRIQRLDSNTFRGLNKLSVCELYSNPFYCSCELLGFLQWLEGFTNMTRTYDRMQCDSPPDYSGYYLLGQGRSGYRNALGMLSSLCTGGPYTMPPYLIPPKSPVTTAPTDGPCPEEECFSGDGTTPQVSLHTPVIEMYPTMKLKHMTHNSAIVSVQIPAPFSKMYTLAQFKNGRSNTYTKLLKAKEDIELRDLGPNEDYTYCVTSTNRVSKYNYTCLTINLNKASKGEPTPSPSTATHYIMTILGCLFGMVIVLGVVYYCLRKKRQQEEKHKKAAVNMKKTIIELKYGPEMETTSISQLSQGQMLGGETMTRIPYLPSVGEVEQYKLIDSSETPKATKGNYMEVRTGEQPERRECELPLPPDSQSSVAEISTITKEVDKVNQIINNCIDALKSESTSFQGVKSGVVSTAEPQLVLLSEQIPGKHSFLAPVYKESYNHPLQRHHSMEVPPKRSSTSSSGSIRSPRSFRSEGSGHKSEAKYIEKTSPTTDTILTVTPAAAILRAEAEKIRQYSEHRHSYPGSHQGEQHDSMGGRKPSILEPLTRPRPRDLAYSQLSPQYHNLSYTSSPEYTCKPSHSIWERFKLNRKRHKDEEEYMAAGHALRKKVQFAKDEDLHDILDYWKGVSAQHKS
ncbi:protein ELFN1 [Hemicordylus capensis]|uniref:protein ELFN1 n=1 Tax=Hemicordylus capensis TaxID=884348 RepID=UPI002303DB58|nr:protein ELFN1 [Hemicordylus capensis]XP_053132138.1 protein ELFN1 [Hemicordylus capensis]XP_053132139.1 protein ELFN1 [Hemicordylus capensis]XP_053132140.1 protein ELFN1 [Hemicordylus capensis]XP_053132141.1 protein ELFN1 [Hemicordylus capensis]XP_053132142.1 protein ELFN1 [Hemicordylus capensis]